MLHVELDALLAVHPTKINAKLVFQDYSTMITNVLLLAHQEPSKMLMKTITKFVRSVTPHVLLAQMHQLVIPVLLL